MEDGTYRLIISNKSFLSVVKLDSKGNFVDSQKFEIKAPTEDDYEQMTVLSNKDNKIYRLNKLGNKEEEAKKEVVEMETHHKADAELNIITVYSDEKMNISTAVAAGDFLCWQGEDQTSKLVHVLNTQLLAKSSDPSDES